MPLDIFTPSRSRVFTYYDRAAIKLDTLEMNSVRVRVQVNVQRSPLELSKNFKYPIPQSWFGYAQGWFQDNHYWDKPIQYGQSIVYDYWNQHGTLAHQLIEYFRRQVDITVAMAEGMLDLDIGATIKQTILERIEEYLESLLCFELPVGDGETFYVNTFNQPVNVFRFNFPLGTVFEVRIDSWLMDAQFVDLLPGNPHVEEPFAPSAPYDDQNPIKTPGGSDPESSYGIEPPPSSPFDPTLDLRDFSNAPAPEPPEYTSSTLVVNGTFVFRNFNNEQPVQQTYNLGPYDEPYTYAWVFQQDTQEPVPRPMYELRVYLPDGTSVQTINSVLQHTETITRVPFN